MITFLPSLVLQILPAGVQKGETVVVAVEKGKTERTKRCP